MRKYLMYSYLCSFLSKMVKTGGIKHACNDGIIKHTKSIEYIRITGRARDSAAVCREKQKLGDRNNIRELRLWRGLKLGNPDFCFLLFQFFTAFYVAGLCPKRPRHGPVPVFPYVSCPHAERLACKPRMSREKCRKRKGLCPRMEGDADFF